MKTASVIPLPGAVIRKPHQGEPCNGCGLCCHLEVCGIGEEAFPGAVAPCPGLVRQNGTDRCAVMLAEQQSGLEPLIQRALGAGLGCGMQDPADRES